MSEREEITGLLKEINNNVRSILSLTEKTPETTFLSIAGRTSIFAGIAGGFVALADFILYLLGVKV